MKPLPFDMTPLTRSLSFAPASRRDTDRADARTDAKGTIQSAPEAAAGARNPEKAAREPFLPRKPLDVEERKVDPPRPAGPATPHDAPRNAARNDPAPSPASTSEPGAIPPRVAKAGAKAPTTELRTASYPLHFKRYRGWSGQLAQEQIHALATHVLARHTERNLRALAVTSALAGEGKTTVTLALAEKLAQAAKRILILDLDAHRATLSHECGLDDAAGALQSSDPRDPTNLDFHVYSSTIPGISIMPAGFPEPGAQGPPILSPVHVGILVLRALEEYDMVLLDCPPLLPVADTHVIGEVVDKALLVVRAGVTPRDMVDQAVEEFGRDKFLAAVLNRTRPQDIPYFREVYGYYRRDSARG
jgi:Mrp family chromosome partitioning ATPase